ncbi:unnamed protein product [Durusdinium trenchii]|uniref:Uncharacterized protein n=1 Tax=Durusdinium trenchii TaxID=1381693 RepID=A0ABP0SRX2_9DINO
MLLTFAVGDHWTLWKAFQDWESCLEEAGLSKVRLKMKRTGQIHEGEVHYDPTRIQWSDGEMWFLE